MLRASVLLLAFFVSVPTFAVDYIRLAAINIEHLGSRTPGQRPIAIAEHFLLASPDIIVLEEISDNDEEDGTRTNEELTSAFKIINEDGQQEWKYELFANKHANDKTQLCGVAWNAKRISKIGDTLRIDVHDDNDPFNSWDRHPHAIKLSRGDGKTDIVVVALHMKANTLRGDNDPNIDQRSHEAELLVGQLDEIRENFSDDDVVLLGDTNILQSNEPSMRKFREAGFVDLNEKGAPTFVDGKAPFDRILVPRGREGREFAFSRQYVLRACDPGAHKEFISDHQMVVTVVKVMDDDDGE